MKSSRKRWLPLLAAFAFGAVSLYLWFSMGQAPFTAAPLPTFTLEPSSTLAPTDTPTTIPTETPIPPSATIQPSPTPTLAPTNTPTSVPTETPIAPTATTQPSATPDEGITTPETTSEPVVQAPVIVPPMDPLAPPFEGRIWVGLYGAATGRGLGILGTESPTDTVSTVYALATEYTTALPNTQVVPFFHMVVTVADPFAGADGDYIHRTSLDTIQKWIDVGTPNGILSVVDIQPGHSTITSEMQYLEPVLAQRGVHLAIDPEFNMKEANDVPGSIIGHMTGDQLNLAQAWLNDLAIRVGERKVLIIHQFDDRMFSGKENIIDYPNVDLVWDSDGFGSPGAKIGDYKQYAAEPGFEYGGFKLFYNYDVPVMSPADVVVLQPRPAFVVYQ